MKNPENARSKLVVSTEQGISLVHTAEPILEGFNSRLGASEDDLGPESVLNELRSFESELGKLAKASARPESTD